MQQNKIQPNFNDDNFLQDWLEKRYGGSVMQQIMDNLFAAELLQMESLTVLSDVNQNNAVNDNTTTLRKKA